MYLITSAAYIGSDLQSEFGQLPPSFLPVGNKRLFHHQISKIPQGEQIYLTLPEDFDIGPYDAHALADYQVTILKLPLYLSLGKSINYALNLIEFDPQEPLYILHGDTLLDELPQHSNMLCVSEVETNYEWTEYDQTSQQLKPYQADNQQQSSYIVNGFFSFASPKKLIKHITIANWDFIEGINGYHQEQPLTVINCEQWYDFGHSQTYYNAKSKMTTQRAFNEMSISKHVVTKRSHKAFKLAAEKNWYQVLPGYLKIYTPQLLNSVQQDDYFEYSIEYLHLTALNELYAFSQLPAFAWQQIIDACCQFIIDAQQYPTTSIIPSAALTQLFQQKTASRLAQFAQENQFDLDMPLIVNGEANLSINQLSHASEPWLPKDNQILNVLHGDFCFSNILFDFRTRAIKVIDPRGIDGDNQACIFGNSLYDIAKLAHSVIGLYDLIIAGYFTVELVNNRLNFSIAETPNREQIISLFNHRIAKSFGVSYTQMLAMQIQLFLSMLPLHADRPERQLAFIGNAYRLYQLLLGEEAA